MTEVQVIVDGAAHRVADDVTVAAALLNLGVMAFRRDLGGAPRGPVCGMGTCYECRVTIDGVAGIRSCLEAVRDGMQIETAR